MPKSRWWYLSFADDGFRGACVVKATDFITAVSEAHRLKINPGGQVIGLPMLARKAKKLKVNCLLTREDLGSDRKSIGELRAAGYPI